MARLLPNEMVITDKQNFRRVVRMSGADAVNLPSGSIPVQQLTEVGLGGMFTVNEKKYYILECDTYDLVMKGIKRDAQIIYPKDAGYNQP